jgi:hypothetical protein
MRADYLNENSGSSFALKKKVEFISAARTLDEDDSGKVFMCDSADGAYSITLPTAATGQDGTYYKFIVWEETPTADITIAAGSAIVSGVNERRRRKCREFNSRYSSLKCYFRHNRPAWRLCQYYVLGRRVACRLYVRY